MDIKEFLLPYPEVSVASPADNADILDFFSRTQLQGKGLTISYDRSPNFFSFLDLHSQDSLVLIYRGKNNELQGVATFVFRQGYVDGKPERVCYLGDLRMGFDRKASVLWRKVYGEFFFHRHQIDQFKNVKKFYTCLIDDNKLSQKSLARNKKSGFAYHPVTPYSMISLMAPKPGTKSSNYQAKEVSGLQELEGFYRQNENNHTAGYLFSTEIPARLKTWPDLKLNDFLVVDKAGETLAACGLWSPSSCKKILLSEIPFYLKAFFQAMRFFSGGKFKFEGELKVLYITHLIFKKDLSALEKEEVFAALLKKAWEIRGKKGYHFLSFCNFHRASLKTAASAFFSNEVKMAIYEVSSSEDPAPPERDTYGFEMALV